MRLSNHSSQRLEITDVQTATRPLHQYFVKERLDRLALGFLHVIAGKVGKPGRHHVPCRDGLFRVQIGRRSAKRINAQRQAFAAKRRPDAHLAGLEQFLRSVYEAVLFLKFTQIDAERKTSQVALGVDDERRNACQRSLFNERLGHDRFSRPGRTQHGPVSSQHLRCNVDGITRVATGSKQHPFWFVVPLF